VSLRILFADDSVTAQNMGKKILTEAGYEVVAVSNGAAAVKKIAEQKPDIIILDVYMPGYSGLEVCEKVRGSIETLKTPVLLTVGKMEPYKPEEANRVRADGVIVKPFEASDLLAIVKKFEERIGQASVPTLVQPILVDRFHESPPPRPQELPVEPEMAILGSVPQATVEVPDHMATTSAFSDLLNIDAAHSLDNFKSTPASPIAARPSSIEAPLPDYDIPVSWRREALPEPTVINAPPAAPLEPTVISAPAPPVAAPEPAPKPAPAPAAAATPPLPLPIRPRPIPVYQEPKERSPLEVVPTAAAPTGDIEIPREPELQESAAEATRNTVAESVEPGLMPTRHQDEELGEDPVAREMAELAPVEAEAAFARLQEVAPDDTPLPEVVEAAPVTEPEPVERKIAESDFEARVAAALAAYNSASLRHEDSTEVAATSSAAKVSAAAAPAFAEQPAAEVFRGETREAAPVSIAPEAEPIATPRTAAQVSTPLAAVPSVPAEVAKEPAHVPEPASVTAPVAIQTDSAAGAEAEADHHTIAQAVHRVMERLKPELVEEIVRELKSKK